jgi:hypothetical protein
MAPKPRTKQRKRRRVKVCTPAIVISPNRVLPAITNVDWDTALLLVNIRSGAAS